MHRVDNIPNKMWFSFDDIKDIVKSYGKELTDKNILEQAILYTTKKKDHSRKFDSPNRIQLFLQLRDRIIAEVKHDADGEEKHIATISAYGFMPLSEGYVQELLNLGSTAIHDFTFKSIGTGTEKERCPKLHSNEQFEIGYADYCYIAREHYLDLSMDSISKLCVHRLDAIKLLKKYRTIAKNAGFKRIQPIIDSATPATPTDDDLTVTDTPVLGSQCSNDASDYSEPNEFSHQTQAPVTPSSMFQGHPAEKYCERKRWFWSIWIDQGRPAMKDFFPKLEDYVKEPGSPIIKFFRAGSDAGIKYRLSTGAEDKISKKTIANYISLFKKSNKELPP